MRKIILSLLAFFFCLSASVAQVPQNLSPNEVYVSDNKNNDSILSELKKIREIQQQSRDKENNAIEQRAKDKDKENLPTEYDAITKIADNTHTSWFTDNWNFYGLFTIILAFIAFIVSYWSYDFTKKTFFAQMKTEEHTTNAPVEVQLWKLKDLPRHFYRNLVCTCAIILKYRFEGKKAHSYPSESNLMKLQTLPDDIILSIDVDKNTNPEENAYKHMHELKLLLRNYNVEVEAASKHLARPTITEESLKQDFDNLLFKPVYLTQSTFKFEKCLPIKNDDDQVIRTIMSMLEEHFRKLIVTTNFDLLFKEDAIGCLDAIFSDKDKVREQFDSQIDAKKGLKRSVDALVKFVITKEEGRLKADGQQDVNVEEVVCNGITFYKTPNYVATIDSKTFKDELTAKLGSNFTKLLKGSDDKCPGIFSINDKSQFEAFYQENFSDGQKEFETDPGVLYEHIKPYFDYLALGSWDLHTLIKHILTVDAAIETDRIGMINYN